MKLKTRLNTVGAILIFSAGSWVGYLLHQNIVPEGKTAPHQVTQPALPGQKLVAKVCFSPRGGGLNMILESLATAKKTLCIAAYSLTSQPIADAVIAAHRRGVRVICLADQSQRNVGNSQLQRLVAAGIPVHMGRVRTINQRSRRISLMHHKVMVIDGRCLLTGSYNFTKNAEEHNAENILWIADPTLCRLYEEEITELFNANQAYSYTATREGMPKQKRIHQ